MANHAFVCITPKNDKYDGHKFKDGMMMTRKPFNLLNSHKLDSKYWIKHSEAYYIRHALVECTEKEMKEESLSTNAAFLLPRKRKEEFILQLDGMLLQEVLNPTQKMCEIAINQNPDAIKYVPSDFLNTFDNVEEILIIAITNNPSLIKIPRIAIFASVMSDKNQKKLYREILPRTDEHIFIKDSIEKELVKEMLNEAIIEI